MAGLGHRLVVIPRARSSAGCRTAPARSFPPHRHQAQPHGLLQAFPQWWELDANLGDAKDTFAPRPPQADQGSQDLSSRKPQQRGFCWFWSMSREICQQRGKHLLDSCVVASSPNFSLFLTSLGGRLQCCMMKREIPNKSYLHSATVMICVDWPHSARCRKISFSRDLASKGWD